MPVTNNLSTEAEELFEYSQTCKYDTFSDAVSLDVDIGEYGESIDPTILLEHEEAKFFGFLDNLVAANPVSNGYSIGAHGDGYITYFPNFIANAMQFLILEQTITESMLDTVKNQSNANNKIAVNGSFYGFVSDKGYGNALVGAMSPSDIIPVGEVFHGGSAIAGTKSSPLGFFVQFASGAFSFGQGDATAGEGLSGLTPILLNNSAYSKVWKYGVSNVYSTSLPSGSNAPTTGDPGQYGSYIEVRSNGQYPGQNAAASGKTIFAYHSTKDAAVFISQDDFWTGGKDLDYYRDNLYKMGFDYAVGFDGSTSAMLYEYSTKKFLVYPSIQKYNSMKIGVLIRS